MARAAGELNVAATALGLQIRNLEEELDVALLERHSRGVRATPCGELLNRYAEDILDHIEAAKAAVRERAGGVRRTLRIGLTPSIVRLVGSDIYTDLAQMLPGVELNVIEDFSFVLVRQLEQGELSCALSFSPRISRRFVRRALLEEDLFLMTSAEHAPTDGGPVAFREAVGHELALTAKQDVVTREVEAIAERLGVDVDITYRVQSIRAVKNLVAKGVAATIMPYGAADAEIRQGLFQARLITAPAVVRTLLFVAPRDREGAGLAPEIDPFIEAIADRLHAAEGPVTRRL